MTDKKRLEEIEAKYSTTTITSERDGTEYTEVGVEDLVFLIQSGFKQAERVKKLEEDIKEWEIVNESWEEINTQIVEQNKRYKQALEEISNADWNSEGLDAERELDMVTDVAFKALEGEE